MATTDQLVTLIKSHYDNDDERFNTLSLQIAAHEAKTGHTVIAKNLRRLVESGKINRVVLRDINPEFKSLFLQVIPHDRLADLIVSDDIKNRIQRVIVEYKNKDLLLRHSLENRRKILLSGPPGTGKTMTANIIAKELGIPMYIILMDKLVTKFMGETSAKLRQIFDVIEESKAVYLFDEFDAIGGERSLGNDVGEMRRVLNSFLQFIENDESESFIIAATNNIKLLDEALFRRFDDVIKYTLPSDKEKFLLLKNYLGSRLNDDSLRSLVGQIGSLSPADIKAACIDALKEALLSGKDLSLPLVERTIKERRSAYNN